MEAGWVAMEGKGVDGGLDGGRKDGWMEGWLVGLGGWMEASGGSGGGRWMEAWMEGVWGWGWMAGRRAGCQGAGVCGWSGWRLAGLVWRWWEYKGLVDGGLVGLVDGGWGGGGRAWMEGLAGCLDGRWDVDGWEHKGLVDGGLVEGWMEG